MAADGSLAVGPIEEEDFDVPEEVETVLEELFKALRDTDTIVRYSAAKGVARVSERLPVDFTEQVLEQVLPMFSIHSIAGATLYDMPSIAEGTWHGACLACAEMARRGLVPDERLSELVEWLHKVRLVVCLVVSAHTGIMLRIQALYFDIRKGAHSIGSNVRDAASYVLWSLARAQSVEALQPHALELARRLVTVSLFDREIHIRRAASAAFQEYVGRTVRDALACGLHDILIQAYRACSRTESTCCARPTSTLLECAKTRSQSLPLRLLSEFVAESLCCPTPELNDTDMRCTAHPSSTISYQSRCGTGIQP